MAAATRQDVRHQVSAVAPIPGHFALPATSRGHIHSMRDEYLKAAMREIEDPTILVNVVSRRVKQLRRGNRPLVESLEKLSAEDTALREIAERKISFELGPTEPAHAR